MLQFYKKYSMIKKKQALINTNLQRRLKDQITNVIKKTGIAVPVFSIFGKVQNYTTKQMQNLPKTVTKLEKSKKISTKNP